MKEHVLGICNMAKHKFCSKLLCTVLYISHIIMAQISPYASNNSFRMSAQWITCKWIKNIWAKFILKYRTLPNVFWVFTHRKYLKDTVGPWLVLHLCCGVSWAFPIITQPSLPWLLSAANVPYWFGALTEGIQHLAKYIKYASKLGRVNIEYVMH